MGRYTYGDIEHKFYFGVQDSDAASQFGGESEHSSIPYFYSSMEDFNLDRLNDLIKQAEKKFNVSISLDIKDPEDLYEYIPNNRDTPSFKEIASLLSDIVLGIKIYQCIKKQNHCSFEAEY